MAEDIEIIEPPTYITNIYIGGKLRPQWRFDYSIAMPVLKKKEKQMLELTCTNEQKIKVTVNPVTDAGAPVTLDGPIAVDVQSGDGTVGLEADGLSFYVLSGTLPGDTVYVVSGDADLGAGVETVSDLVTLHVEGAKASSLGMVADAPELK